MRIGNSILILAQIFVGTFALPSETPISDVQPPTSSNVQPPTSTNEPPPTSTQVSSNFTIARFGPYGGGG